MQMDYSTQGQPITHRPTMQQRANAFSLIELLVVIAIIAILATLLFPAIGRAIESSRSVACTSNLKQFGVAMLSYASDHDNRPPSDPKLWYTKEQLGQYMNASLDSYTPSKNVKLFLCASDRRSMNDRQDGGSKLWMNLPNGGYGYLGISYGINTPLCGDKNLLPWYIPHALSSIEKASGCFLFADAISRDIWNSPNFFYRHNDRVNAVFADAHVGSFASNSVTWYAHQYRQTLWLGGPDP